jgi:hypothetical protein
MIESEEIVEQCISELEKNALSRRHKLMEMRARFAGIQKENGGSREEGDETQP